ncbi:adenosylcobinamide-GDP ribazoletransferase [Catenovulum sp. SM1970]|uniref:adenosylcobinamide-GDP ribazoletransferase n=1 Tax=Marinifaba aquimaris TaxID=2741323 RepID=UPI001571CDF3|nr:adenosylcobinamide-GDP ribazoletransferase [Marinifaba aquimaris]NTS77771.1 adenosylcobinamide-GDP ribazoletransferase [Marinifaba aquimaris]
MLTKIKAELNLFYLALGFFSRIPMPKQTQYSEQFLHQSNRYFSLVGLLLGLIFSLSLVLFLQFLPAGVAILLAMTVSLLLTGAFHEDGLADMVDAIGGGYTLEKRLTIMKDSRLGTYGATGLFICLALKFSLLYELIVSLGLRHLSAGVDYWLSLILILLTAASSSRAIAGSLIYDMKYVADIDASKSKPLAARQTRGELICLLLVGAFPLLFFTWSYGLALVGTLFIFRCYFKAWLNKRLTGYTGDCLGATQQIAELVVYLFTLIYLVNFDYALLATWLKQL